MKHLLLVSLILLIGMSTANAQLPTVSLTSNQGLTICEGTEIQIDLAITPDRPEGDPGRQYSVNWRRDVGNPLFINNCQFPQSDGSCSFIRDTPRQTTTYTVEVNGSAAGQVVETITINVEQIPNAGLDTSIFLCGKTGVINLFDELDGGPDTGGTWSNGSGTYDTSNPDGGAFTYTIAGSGACPPQSATIIVKPCGVNDTDGDGVTNDTDQDKDNDGIPNSVEDAFCNGGAGSTTPIFVLEEDFGFGGPARSRYAASNLEYNPGLPQDTDPNFDGEYNVATSTYFRTAAGFDQTFLSTNLNPNPETDANGDTDGRYLAINMKTSAFIDQPVFIVRDLPVTPGVDYDFSMQFTSLNDDPNEVPAHLSIQVIDQVTNTLILEEDRGEIPDAQIDQWLLVQRTFQANTSLVTIQVVNKQTTSGNGNDIGIDNVFLSTNACDFDRDGIPNSEDLDSDNDGIYDIVEANLNANDTDNDGRFNGPVDPVTGSSTTIVYTSINTDGDGTNDNFLDIDSDNDGIIDNIEAQTTLGYRAPRGVDGDFNGVDDAYDTRGIQLNPVNSNASTDPDYIDLNSDLAGAGDCLEDTIEAYDTNQDGVADTVPAGIDDDGDGLDNAFDQVTLGRLTGETNAGNANLPEDFPNNHNPNTPEVDWREEFTAINEMKTVENCASGTATFDLFDELTEANITGGTWSGPAGQPALTNGSQGTFTPGTNVNGTYVYTLPVIASCPSRTATVEVTLGTAADAGGDGNLTVCNNESTIYNLFDRLTGTPDTGGRWEREDPAGNIPFGIDDRGVFDPTTDPTGTYFYTVGTPGCDDTSEVSVVVNEGADPGENANTSLCSTDLPVDLFDLLEGNPDPGGSWSGPGPAGNVTNGFRGTIDPAVAESGDYIYTVFNSACPTPVASRVIVTIEAAPVFTLDDLICATDRTSYAVEFTTNGTWNYFITPNVGTVDVAGNTITGIPENTDVEIQVVNPNNPDCFEIVQVIAPDCSCPNVDAPVDSTAQNDKIVCFGNDNNTLFVSVMAGLQANWYSEDDELLAINSTTFVPTVTEPGFYTFFVEAEDVTINCTSERIPIIYEILTAPEVELEVLGTLCIDENGLPFQTNQNERPEIISGLSETEFTFQWSFENTPIANATGSSLTDISQAGTYALFYTNVASGCSSTSEVIVNAIRAIAAGDLTLELSRGQFADQNDLIAVLPYEGNFEYSLNGGPTQTSNVFRNVPLGLNEVTVFESNGCGQDTNEIKVFGFPAFFTPNGDGKNDLWNVKIQGDEEIPNMEIFIFDRYGKLMRRQEPTDLGWDGNFNGRPLPSTDYWYTARLLDGSGIEYTGHFNLRR